MPIKELDNSRDRSRPRAVLDALPHARALAQSLRKTATPSNLLSFRCYPRAPPLPAKGRDPKHLLLLQHSASPARVPFNQLPTQPPLSLFSRNPNCSLLFPTRQQLHFSLPLPSPQAQRPTCMHAQSLCLSPPARPLAVLVTANPPLTQLCTAPTVLHKPPDGSPSFAFFGREFPLQEP